MAANDEVITYLFSWMPTKADAQITYYSLDSRCASLNCFEDSGGASNCWIDEVLPIVSHSSVRHGKM